MKRPLYVAAIAAVALSIASLAGATVPTSTLQSRLSTVNGTANQSGQFDDRQKLYNTAVRDNFVDVQAQLDALGSTVAGLSADLQALEARVAALEGEEPLPPPPPSGGTQLLAPAEGATLSGTVTVRWRAVPEAEWGAVYTCGGHVSLEDLTQDANNEFEVQWDTTEDPTNCTNGEHFIDAWAFNSSAPVGNPPNHGYMISLQNSPPPPPPPPAACDPQATPGPISGQGYSQVFADCFTTLDRTTWCSHQWYEPNPASGSQSVDAAGVLHLVRTRAQGFANTTMSTEPCGQTNPKRFKYGYFEARMKFDSFRGQGPAFWLLSTRHQQHAVSCSWTQATADVCPTGGSTWNPNVRNAVCSQLGEPTAQCLTSELDVFEGFGNIQYGGTRQDDFFSGTIHRNTSDFYGVANSSRFTQRGTGLEMDDWHVYAALWTPTQICWFIDDVQQGCQTPFDSTPQPMHLLVYNWNTEWEDENMPTATSPSTLDAQFDWVRVWQQ